MNKMLSLVALIAGGALLVGAPFAAAEVPTPADFASCNAKAAHETRTAGVGREPGSTGSGSGRPDDARGGVPAASPRTDVEIKKPAPGAPPSGTTDPSGKTITGSHNPQLEGMAADRAGDPAYVAAYRTCMRQRGF